MKSLLCECACVVLIKTHSYLLVLGDLQLGGEGDLGPVQQTSKHLPGLGTVSVDRLLANDDKVRLLPLLDC